MLHLRFPFALLMGDRGMRKTTKYLSQFG